MSPNNASNIADLANVDRDSGGAMAKQHLRTGFVDRA
jgi:hypothetical protein